jgi:hypothetical protein
MTNSWDTREGGLLWRTVLSIVAIFGWLVFLVLWLFFLTPELGLAQNIAVFLMSLLVVIALLLVTWVTWALKFPHPIPQQVPGYPPFPRYSRLKSGVGGLSAIAWLTFMVIWLFFYASDFTLYENLGIVLASLLIVTGVNWAVSLVVR